MKMMESEEIVKVECEDSFLLSLISPLILFSKVEKTESGLRFTAKDVILSSPFAVGMYSFILGCVQLVDPFQKLYIENHAYFLFNIAINKEKNTMDVIFDYISEIHTYTLPPANLEKTTNQAQFDKYIEMVELEQGLNNAIKQLNKQV